MSHPHDLPSVRHSIDLSYVSKWLRKLNVFLDALIHALNRIYSENNLYYYFCYIELFKYIKCRVEKSKASTQGAREQTRA